MRQLLLTVSCLVLTGPLAAQRALTATRQLVIDGAEQDFSQVSRISVSGSGVVAVAQPQDNVIRFFDRRGVPLGTFGRAGEGPGEFRTLGLLGWVGDTLPVADTRLRRTTWIGPGPKLVRTSPFPQEVPPPPAADGAPLVVSVYPQAATSDGGMISSAILRRNGSLPPWIPFHGEVGSVFLRLRADGQYQKLLAVRGSLEGCAVQEGTTTRMIPYCSRPMEAISPDGAHIITVLPAADAGYGVVSIDGVSGDTVFARQYRYQPVPVSRRVADSTRESLATGIGGSQAGADGWRRMPVAETYPPLARVHVGNDGTVWLEEYSRAPAPRRWRMLDRTGAVVGVLDLPRNVTVSVVSREEMWAIVEDSDDLQDVVLFRVR